MITHKTQANRALRRLWNCLDEVLLPFLPTGILLAVSGGPDSRALLESVALWPRRHLGKILVCSIDHGIRKEAKKESNLIKWRAQRLGFEAFTKQIVPLKKNEAHLREQRYEILCQIAQEHNVKSLVTAHHRDDNAEGFLLALAGFGGGHLGEAMSPIGSMNGLRLLRPFLSLNKADLMVPLTLLDQTDYVHDSLDEARVGQRAFLRHEVLPSLNSLGPFLKERLALFAENQLKQNEEINKKALDSITYIDKEEFFIDLNKNLTLPIIERGIREALKICSKNNDLRSSRPTLSKLMQNVNKKIKGLDPMANMLKIYHFSGARVIVEKNFVIIKRV